MLEKISAAKLKNMTREELLQLADEVREKIIATVMKSGGHLSSNLGTVELTIALHYVFDFPRDKVIFDVGHQCYTHKLLSGRADKFDTIRRHGGLSGFPKREESEYDCYNTGHSGTSISAALGLAKVRDLKKEDYNVIAIIGDGSFNNGIVYEAFNSLRLLKTNVLVIINDNGMSIAPTVGSMHEYLEILSENSEQKEKLVRHANIFEKFGFKYEGVYNGNDLFEMIDKLSEIKERLKYESVILHVATKKGKGYAFCEENPEKTHGISATGAYIVGKEYSEVLGKKLTEIAAHNEKIVAVTAAMTSALGLSEFFEKFPERSIDVGICEEHAAILCASMAAGGMKPYYAVYSTFLQRSFDEIVLDICSQNLPVTLCIDRAGISGADGETHQGVFDLSFLNIVPNLTVAVPKDVIEFEKMLDFSEKFNYPLAIRYPRSAERIFDVHTEIEYGKWEILSDNGGQYVLIACGERAIAACTDAERVLKEKGVAVTVVNARFVKPLDKDTLEKFSSKIILTVEDNVLLGGFGESVDAYFADRGVIVKNFAYGDCFIPQGEVKELMAEFGVCSRAIVDYVIGHENR